MERKFYTNDFEQLLKENADQFKMSPSKKVWRGIYNDLHPGRRWPSVAISLLFVFTMILIGYLNTEQDKYKLTSKMADGANPPKNKNAILLGSLVQKAPQKNTSFNRKAMFNPGREFKMQALDSADKSTLTQNVASSPENINQFQQSNGETMLSVLVPGSKVLLEDNRIMDRNAISTEQKETSTATSNSIAEDNIHFKQPGKLQDNNGLTAGTIPLINNTADTKAANAFVVIPANVSGTTENGPYTIVNNPVKIHISKKGEDLTPQAVKSKVAVVTSLKVHKNPKVNWAYYVSPGISYRSYSQGNKANQFLAGYNNFSNISNLNKVVIHHVSPGLEGGIAFKYSLSTKLKFTSGLQLNYSAYTIQANNIHPIIATLILHNQKTGINYPYSSISYFGNGPGNVPVNLHNYSVQFGIPLGLEYQLAGNDRIQFFAAGSVQPSLVVANKSYILSTDRRNYLTDASIVRHWNMGTNIGTFASFSSNKLKWQIGPQVRYQLLSSYKNSYQFREHFIDYSIRFTISKK